MWARFTKYLTTLLRSCYDRLKTDVKCTFGEDRTCSFEGMNDRGQTNTHTDRHAHRNIPLPYRGRSSLINRKDTRRRHTLHALTVSL